MTGTPPPLPPSEPPKKSGLLPDAQWICCFLIAFTGFLFITRPATNPAQITFRLVLMLIGVVGLIIIRFKKSRP